MCLQDSETCPLEVWILYVTKGRVAFRHCCCGCHTSMWSLEMAAVQCQRVYRVCLCGAPGAEPILGVPSTLHHAAPSKNSLSLDLLIIATLVFPFNPNISLCGCNRIESFFCKQTGTILESCSYTYGDPWGFTVLKCLHRNVKTTALERLCEAVSLMTDAEDFFCHRWVLNWERRLFSCFENEPA